MSASQTAFAFCGPDKPPENPLCLVREVKVSMIRETCETRRIDSPETAAQFWREIIEIAPWFDPMKEHLIVVMLDTRYHLSAYNLVSIGTLNESHAHPREILRPVIVCAAYGFVLLHNHPSGDPSPSQADHSLTRRMREACELLQIKLLDHVIIGDPKIEPHTGHFSFKECGIL